MNRRLEKKFTFDGVFGIESTQSEIYREVCIFARLHSSSSFSLVFSIHSFFSSSPLPPFIPSFFACLVSGGIVRRWRSNERFQLHRVCIRSNGHWKDIHDGGRCSGWWNSKCRQFIFMCRDCFGLFLCWIASLPLFPRIVGSLATQQHLCWCDSSSNPSDFQRVELSRWFWRQRYFRALCARVTSRALQRGVDWSAQWWSRASTQVIWRWQQSNDPSLFLFSVWICMLHHTTAIIS